MLAIVWAGLRPVTSTWGWDEAMHAELPAARMSLALHSFQLGEFFDVLLSCEQYPFGFPLILAAAQTVFGISEVVARAGRGRCQVSLRGVSWAPAPVKCRLV